MKTIQYPFFQLTKSLHDSSAKHPPKDIILTLKSLCEMETKPTTPGEVTNDLVTALTSIKYQLSLEDLSLGIFYLSKLLEEPSSLRPIVEYFVERTRDEEHVDLSTLSRLTVILNTLREIPYFYTYPVVVPRIEGHLRRLDLSEEDLINITVAMKHFTR